MKLQLAMPENWMGGPRSSPAAAAARGNVIVLPAGSHAAAYTALNNGPTTPTLDGGRSEELLRLENCWLDLTSDIASFMELSQIPEVVKEDREEEEPVSPLLMPTPSLILPNNTMEMASWEDRPDDDATATEILMHANMKILENFILESTTTNDDDDSLDSMASDLDANQNLIEEVENYLLATSGGEPTTIAFDGVPEIEFKEMRTKGPVQIIAEGNCNKQALSTEQQINNTSILKAQVAGKVLATAGDDDDSLSSGGDLTLDLTEEDLSNAYTTTIKTENGQDVIIIIAQSGRGSPPSHGRRETQSPFSLSPPSMAMDSPEDFSSSSSDYEWSPSPAGGQPAGQPQRKKYQRKNKPTLTLEPYPRDKTERKKAQNRTAAFRYREKKKAELDAADTELEQLAEQNGALKARLRDMEQEFRCLKRLMVESGLGHLIHEAGSLSTAR